MNPADFCRRIFSASSCFVAVNCFCTFGSVLQYMLFMRLFEFREMGIITLFHTVITLTGMTQIGLLNGGFRIFSQNMPLLEPRVNNTVFSFFGLVFFAALLLLPVHFVMPKTGSLIFVSAGIIVGCLTMMKTWLTNINIAHVNLTQLNWVNLITTCLSFLFFLLIPVLGVIGGMMVVTFIPLAFCLVFLCWHREMRPFRFTLKKRTVLWILYFGFVPFLTSIMTLINLEIGNLGIKFSLGTESLGKFALVQLYTNCFMLIPSSITLLFYPKMLLAYKSGDQAAMTRSCRLFVALDAAYVLCAAFGTFAVLPFFIRIFFPRYLVAIPFVYCVLPGLCVTVLFMAISTVLYVNLILRPVFFIYCCSVILTLAGILVLGFSDAMSLTRMALLKCFVSVFISLALGVCYLLKAKTLRVRFSLTTRELPS